MVRGEPVHERDLELPLRLLELLLAHELRAQPRDLGEEELLHLLDLRVRPHRREGVEEPGIGELPVRALGAERLLALVHEAAVEPARAAARQDLARDVERLAVRVARGRRVPRAGEDRAAHVDVDHLAALAVLLGLARGIARDRLDGREPAERLAHVRQRLLGVEIADDREPHVVRRVVGMEELARDLGGRGLDVAAPADHRCAVGMRAERQRHQRLEGAALGVVLGAQAPLLEHHLALALELLLADVEVRDALSLERDRERQRLGRDVLEEDGEVVGREGVDLTAARLDQSRVLLPAAMCVEPLNIRCSNRCARPV